MWSRVQWELCLSKYNPSIIVMCTNPKEKTITVFINAVKAPELEEVCITYFYDFLITPWKQYTYFRQLIFDNSFKIVALIKPFNNKNIAVIKMSFQVLNDQKGEPICL